jgi:dTDP-4-dehydrorhamnose reductase
VENTVYISNELKVPLLWIGIAGIFGGRQDRCGHWGRPKPLGVYARAKWAGGESVRINARTYLICRAGWMVGGGPSKDRKSVKKLMRKLHDGQRELGVVDDRLGTPAYTRDLALDVRLRLERRSWGPLNMVCRGGASRPEVARALVDESGLGGTVDVHPVRSAYFAETYFAPRPDCGCLVDRQTRPERTGRHAAVARGIQ